jgi:hypothetical protein
MNRNAPLSSSERSPTPDPALDVIERKLAESMTQRDPNALQWPPGRSDVISAVCLIMAGLMLYLRQPDWLIAFVFACGVFTGLSPRISSLVLRARPEGVDAEVRFADPPRAEVQKSVRKKRT